MRVRKRRQEVGNETIIKIGSMELIQMERVKKESSKTQTEEKIDEILKNSDLSPGVYEGGFKLWECAVDLIHHLEDESISFENKRVLDLGCGFGFPGIFALKKGAIVYFQDYVSLIRENWK